VTPLRLVRPARTPPGWCPATAVDVLRRAAAAADRAGSYRQAAVFRQTADAVAGLVRAGLSTTDEAWRWTPPVSAVVRLAEDWL
jgi:hypothetical protein